MIQYSAAARFNLGGRGVLDTFAGMTTVGAAHVLLMKIPRWRQDPHIARMADFLPRIIRMLAPVVMQWFDQRRAGRHRMLSAERVIGKADQIMRAIV